MRDPAYLASVRQLPCLLGVPGVHCYGRTHAHHAGRGSMGKKAPDDTAVPLCLKHHQDWHGASGYFKEMGQEARREWAEEAIMKTRAMLAPY